MIEMTCHDLIKFLISGNDVISLDLRPLNFRVIKHVYNTIEKVNVATNPPPSPSPRVHV